MTNSINEFAVRIGKKIKIIETEEIFFFIVKTMLDI